jgi:uncharacterized protein (TIGR04255 family)
MAKRYKKPPIIEALCELRFQSSQPWDLTIPGLVYERIARQFPKKRHQNIIHFEVSKVENKTRQDIEGSVMIQFLNNEEKALVQLGPDLLTVNHLLPYPGWDIFKRLIAENVQKYCDVTKPSGLKRIGLRYINRIVFPQAVNSEDYFRISPKVPEPIPQVFRGSLLSVEIAYEEIPAMILRLSFGTSPSRVQNEVPSILDLDIGSAEANIPKLEELENWLEQAHNRLEIAFEASCQDKTRRDIFEEIME